MFKTKYSSRVHFIGIGGIGMSAIAEVLVHLGHDVQGSDINENINIKRLKNMGVKCFIGHHPDNIRGATMVVYSSAVKTDNEEYKEAINRGLPVIRRAEMLSELMRLKFGIAVAGTHGKTTTTALISTILSEAKKDPSYIIGGAVHNLGGHAKVGPSDYLVVEADESDGSFLLLGPIMSIITNIDDDHLDHYGNKEKLKEAFIQFANKVPFYGLCCINIDDPVVKSIVHEIKRPLVTYSVQEDDKDDDVQLSDYLACSIITSSDETTFDLYFRNEKVSTLTVPVLGKHNIYNCLSAIALTHQLGLNFTDIIEGLQKFEGVGRRLEPLFERSGLKIMDDYGHHPTEINAAITTLYKHQNKRPIVIFEPHRYSRTQQCWSKFLHCFNGAEKVYMLPIYSAGERPIAGVDSSQLVEDINRLHPGLACSLENYEALEETIIGHYGQEALILTLGAGQIGKMIREQVKKIEKL